MTLEKLAQKYDMTRIKNNASYNGAKLRITDIKRKDGEMISRKEMTKMCDGFLSELQNKYKDVDGIVSVSIKYPNRWYSADVSKLNSPINYFSLDQYEEMGEDPEYYEQIRFSFIPFKKSKEGGKDEHNDCLINCIRKYCPKKIIDHGKLKAYLGLERDDPIPVDKVKDVEEYINEYETQPYAIFISGDAEYISTLQTNRQIHIVLSKNHYSVNSDKTSKIRRKCYEEKRIIMVDQKGDFYECFDGENTFIMSMKELYETKNLIVEKNYSMESKKMCLEDAYFSYIEMADELKRESDGLFNFYKTPTVKDMALNHFHSLTQAYQPADISNNETDFINNASCHAVTYWEKYSGNVHIFDINSRYPHVMQKSTNMFPIKAGTWRIIDSIQEKPEYGIYRCTISKVSNEQFKFFVFNSENHYTHLDVIMAQAYGLKIELICDGKANFLHYPKDCLVSGALLFKKYIDDLYPLKLRKVKGAKLLLNILWGALTESRTFKKTVDYDVHIDLSGCDVKKLETSDKLRTQFTKMNERKFKTNYGRIKPFLLAFARNQFYFSFRKWEHLIVRMHTDSLYLIEVPSDMLPPSDKLGCLKFEGEYKVQISGLNKVSKTKI